MPKQKEFMVSVNPVDVMYTNISTSKNGYNSATMVIKKGDSEYMNISYEWQGDSIPGFAMDLMAFMKTNKQEQSGVWAGQEESFAEFSAKTPKKEMKKDMKEDKEEMCPDCKKPMSECVCKK